MNFAFDCITVKSEELTSRLSKYKAMTKRLNPSYIFLSENVYKLSNGLEIGCYDCQGEALDSDIYYLNFFTDLLSGELFGWFNCPADLREQWEPLVRQMIQTIEIAAHDEEESLSE